MSTEEESATRVGRIVYDVMVYTLKKCGLPEEKIPPSDFEENTYERVNFVELAGTSALRVSLIMRDKWQRMFMSRHNSSGLHDENVSDFLMQVALCCPLSRTKVTLSLVELFLALCNEIMLFFHHENIGFDFNMLIKSISMNIVNIVRLSPDSSETVDELFDDFDNISEYSSFITDFIATFATPYGFRNDASDIFFDFVKKKYRDDLRKLKDNLGFLPPELFSAIEESVHQSENLVSASSSVLSGDRKSPEPPILAACSESDVPDEKLPEPPILTTCSESDVPDEKSPETQPTPPNVSEPIDLSSPNSKKSSRLEIEDEFKEMKLEAEEAFSKSHGEMPKKKSPKKKTKNK